MAGLDPGPPGTDGKNPARLALDGHKVTVTHPHKVLYPATGTTKAQVVDYYVAIAPAMLPHIRGRPVTRKRWPNGVAHASFFEKNLPDSAPKWLARRTIEHRSHTTTYPLVDSVAGLAWLGQQAALELHVPQWTFSGHDQGPATRLVFDLDPGPGAGLAQCAEVAFAIREVLDGAGLAAYPVTSGSKGLHLYVPLERPIQPAAASKVARRIAEDLAKAMPSLVTATMAKDKRTGKVLVDWSQNNGAKTTIAPYSLRGREEPTVAAPRTWAELSQSDFRQLRFDEVLARHSADGDLLADLAPPAPPEPSEPDRLTAYRAKRDADRTPEPVPSAGPAAGSHGAGSSFVIQEHHARRLHWDFRLERDGVLVSWALPKNLPTDPKKNHLAVHVEDHPLEYGSFEGEIPKGEYGGGHVQIWDRGTYETVKWRDGEVIVDLHGDRATGRYALIRTDKQGDKNWLIHLMKTPDGTPTTAPKSPIDTGAVDTGPIDTGTMDLRPMLAVPGDISGLPSTKWSFEGKWDGFRVLVEVSGGEIRLRSRSGRDMTAEFPQFLPLVQMLSEHDAVLDGELVALDDQGVPSFALMQDRGADTDLRLLVFDVLQLDGRTLTAKPYRDRRRVLEALAPLVQTPDSRVEVPAPLDGPPAAALSTSAARGLEGVVAKRLDSAYHPGSRSHEWIKHKHWSDMEIVIGGWRAGRGSRAQTFGSLLMGVPGDGGLRYVGRVGTGFTERQLAKLIGSLEPLRRETSPFTDGDLPDADEAVWVSPTLVGEVRYAEWTSSGHLRHPTWRGLRTDKSPDDVAGAPSLPG